MNLTTPLIKQIKYQMEESDKCLVFTDEMSDEKFI
jgi:hypothetical protein